VGRRDDTVVIRQKWSVAMKKLIGIVIVAMGVGAPTFVLSPHAADAASATHVRAHPKTAYRHPGVQTYAMSPRGRAAAYGGYLNNFNTGGGSPGYNEMLLTW
jgi:hypothetical protein